MNATEGMASKWLLFEEIQLRGMTTRTWIVSNKRNNTLLGEVRWYGQWRQYAFIPDEFGTVLAGSCLSDLAEFIRRAMSERKGK